MMVKDEDQCAYVTSVRLIMGTWLVCVCVCVCVCSGVWLVCVWSGRWLACVYKGCCDVNILPLGYSEVPWNQMLPSGHYSNKTYKQTVALIQYSQYSISFYIIKMRLPPTYAFPQKPHKFTLYYLLV
jgi:hypothetical protein